MNKPLKIMLEGCDKTGKSTLHKLLKEEYPDIDIVDRSILSDIVFNKLFNRSTYMGVPVDIYENYWLYFHKENTDSRVILFLTDTNILVERSKKFNEPFCKNRTDEQLFNYIDNEQKEFVRSLAKYRQWFTGMLYVDTTKDTIEETLKKIKAFIDESTI